MNTTVIEKTRQWANKYGFCLRETQKGFNVMAKDVDGRWFAWIKYGSYHKTVSIMGNSDECNLWFCETRPDLTPEVIVNMVIELNAALETEITIQALIDPEDWQEIAHVQDADEDDRYCSTTF